MDVICTYFFRELVKVFLGMEMAEVSVINWLVYFILVLIVSKLSLHHARYTISMICHEESKESKAGKSS